MDVRKELKEAIAKNDDQHFIMFLECEVNCEWVAQEAHIHARTRYNNQYHNQWIDQSEHVNAYNNAVCPF